jgi:hypothetical protein
VLIATVSAPPAAASHADPKPNTVRAWYMDTAADATMYNMGCAQADRVDADTDPDVGVVILTFGAPREVDSEHTRNGASMFAIDPAGWRSTTQIADGTKEYSRGFWACLDEPASSVDYWLALGVSNLYPSRWTGDRIAEHGQAWGIMVAAVRQYQVDRGFSQAILATGAADIEPAWGGPTKTRRWVNAFDAVANSGLLWNFGSADGCPRFGQGGTSCDNNWTQGDLHYVSWGAPAGVPAPQIYRNDGAMVEQWVLISKWGIDNANSGLMGFRGPLSQQGACSQRGCDPSLDNTPRQAWDQMVEKMDARPATIVDMSYSTDIRWRNP